MTRYLVTICIDDDPLRTRDVAVQANSAYHAGWLYRRLNSNAKIVKIREARG